MKNVDINQKFAPISVELGRMARSICLTLRLPSDDSLAFVIGGGTELSSESAVVTWLNNNGFEPGPLSFQKACSALQRTLEESIGAT